MHFSSEVDENLGMNKNKAFMPLRKTLPEMVRTTCLKVSGWLFTRNRSACKLAKPTYKPSTSIRIPLPGDCKDLLIPQVRSPESASVRTGSLPPRGGGCTRNSTQTVFDLICKVIEVQHSAQVSGVTVSPPFGSSVHSSLWQSVLVWFAVLWAEIGPLLSF